MNKPATYSVINKHTNKKIETFKTKTKAKELRNALQKDKNGTLPENPDNPKQWDFFIQTNYQ